MKDPKYQPMSIEKMASNKSECRKEMAAEIIAAYVRNNKLPAAKLPELIKSVYEALAAFEASDEGAEPEMKPTVSPAKSVSRGYVVCLEDGLRFKSMKRHLNAAHGMSPEAYREKWHLSKDHPIVAPAYSRRRSAIAKAAEFGRRSKAKTQPSTAAARRHGKGLEKAA